MELCLPTTGVLSVWRVLIMVILLLIDLLRPCVRILGFDRYLNVLMSSQTVSSPVRGDAAMIVLVLNF